MHAERCPVCVGTGKIEKETCHGCGGKGWVEVTDNEPCYYPYIPYRYPDYPPSPSTPPWPYSPTVTTWTMKANSTNDLTVFCLTYCMIHSRMID